MSLKYIDDALGEMRRVRRCLGVAPTAAEPTAAERTAQEAATAATVECFAPVVAGAIHAAIGKTDFIEMFPRSGTELRGIIAVLLALTWRFDLSLVDRRVVAVVAFPPL